MANAEKSDLSHRIEAWSKYLGLVSALVSVLTSLSGNALIAYISLGVLGLIVGEHCIRVIFQKSPIQQVSHILLPSSVTQRGEKVYRYPTAERRMAIIWLAGLTSLFISVGGFNLWQTLKPPVSPARGNEILILVTQFQSSVSTESKYDFAQLIYDDLVGAFPDSDIRIEKLEDWVVTSSEDAQKLGKRTNAALVIWGKFDESFVYPRYEVLKSRNQISHFDLGHTPLQKESEHLEFTLGIEIPQGMVYLTKFTIGQIYYLDQEYEKALDAFNNALTILEENNLLDLEKRETLDWKEEYVYFYRANTFIDLGKFSYAMLDYQLAIKKNQKFAEAYNNLGVGYSLLGDSNRAIEQFDLALKNRGGSITYYNRGGVFFHQRDFQKTIEDYSKAIDIDPQTPLFYQARADGYFASCEYGQARDDLTVAIKLLKDDAKAKARALTNRGITYTKMGEYGKAVKDFEDAIDLNSDLASAYYNLAATKSLMGETEAAMKSLLEAIHLDEGMKTLAACDAEFDNIRNRDQMPDLTKPKEGCPPVSCP